MVDRLPAKEPRARERQDFHAPELGEAEPAIFAARGQADGSLKPEPAARPPTSLSIVLVIKIRSLVEPDSMSVIRAQKRSSKEPKGAASNGALSALETEAIGLFVQLGRMVGQPRSVAEVYGLLYISTRPMAIMIWSSGSGRVCAAAERALYIPEKSRGTADCLCAGGPAHPLRGGGRAALHGDRLRARPDPAATGEHRGPNRPAGRGGRKLPGEERGAKLSTRAAMLDRAGARRARELGADLGENVGRVSGTLLAKRPGAALTGAFSRSGTVEVGNSDGEIISKIFAAWVGPQRELWCEFTGRSCG